jgi:DNA repair exonuclease SbcCD ATPase subunit
MDEKANDDGSASDTVSGSTPDPDDEVPAPTKSTDRLVSRLAELRAQVEVLAPPDQGRGREAIERMLQAQERVATLEQMLARAREREDGLTVQTIRDQAAIADSEARLAEMIAIAARGATSEAARREEETVAAEANRRLTLAQAEADARQAEIERLRSRCAELETDLSRLAREVAAATVARAEASRTQRERNEARDRASAERRLAAEDRRRAAEANLRATELQSQLRAAERRIVKLTNERSASGTEPEVPPNILESKRTEAPVEASADTPAKAPTAPAAPAEAPWTTLQRASFAAAGSAAPVARTADESDVIDLTQAPGPVEQETTNGNAGPEDVPAASTASSVKGIGLFGRVLRGRHHDPHPDPE